MRTSIASAAFLLVGAGAATLAAVDTTGSNIALNGSDTLFDVTQTVLSSCATQFSDFSAQNITYLGGGSGVGAGQMLVDAQQVSPMSRALKNTEFCSAPAPAGPGLTEGLLVGIDGVAISANTTNSCSSSAANGFGLTSTTINVTSDGTSAGTPVGTYQIANSFDALKVLYFGLTNDGVYNCASPTRKSLIRNWHNLFASDCAAGDSTCAAGLTHAWRRSDLSGTTDAFVSVLNPTGRGIGTLPTVPVGAAQKTNPFCNSADANATTTTTSFGGASDSSDLDPVRTPCEDPNDSVCQPFANFGTTSKFAGDLGVVLPVLIPDATSTLPADLYPTTACGTACVLVSPIKGSLLSNYPNFKCPGGGAPIGGKCYTPFAGSATSPNPQCVSASTTKCVGLQGKPDGRQYNLAVIVPVGQIAKASRGTSAFQYALDANSNILSQGAFYRIHSNLSSSYAAASGSTPGYTGICQENDDTSQIGCLTDADPCSIGFAGREAARTYPGISGSGPVSAPLKALSVNGTPPFTPGSDPDLALKNLLQPTGTTPLYPLSRRLYFATTYEFDKLQGGELELAKCYATSSIVEPAISGHGFVAVPGGVQCLDYPETAGTSSPAPNVQGTGNVALGGCGSASNTDACAASAAAGFVIQP